MYAFVFFNDTATPEIYTLSLHDALPIFDRRHAVEDLLGELELALGRRAEGEPAAGGRRDGLHHGRMGGAQDHRPPGARSEEHTSELQSRQYLVCPLLFEKKKLTTCRCHH